MDYTLKYKVTADWLPFREWFVMAESESEARMQIVQQFLVKYEETDAELANT